MSVPLLDLKLQYRELKPEIDAALIRVAESQACILGPEVDALERAMEEYLGVKHAIGISSGTDALLLAFMALDIGVGDEVIVPTFSFFATAGCVSRTGALPVFVDSELDSFNIDVQEIRNAITSKTKAIVPVHLFGTAANMDAIMELAAEFNIPVVEDAAQAIGTQTSDGKRVGSIGQVGCFSFYPTKNLGAFGDAGLITTNDSVLATKIKQLRNHGMEPRYFHSMIGGNFRIDGIQAAVLCVKLKYLEQWHQARRNNAALYTEAFIKAGLSSTTGVTQFCASDRVLLPFPPAEGAANTHIYNQFTIRVEHRDELRAFLQSKQIGTEVYYPVPFHRQECFQDVPSAQGAFPVADLLTSSVLSLPIFPELLPSQIEEVVETIAEYCRNSPP